MKQKTDFDERICVVVEQVYEQKSVGCTATQSCVNAVITAITPTVSQLCGRYNLFFNKVN